MEDETRVQCALTLFPVRQNLAMASETRADFLERESRLGKVPELVSPIPTALLNGDVLFKFCHVRRDPDNRWKREIVEPPVRGGARLMPQCPRVSHTAFGLDPENSKDRKAFEEKAIFQGISCSIVDARSPYSPYANATELIQAKVAGIVVVTNRAGVRIESRQMLRMDLHSPDEVDPLYIGKPRLVPMGENSGGWDAIVRQSMVKAGFDSVVKGLSTLRSEIDTMKDLEIDTKDEDDRYSRLVEDLVKGISMAQRGYMNAIVGVCITAAEVGEPMIVKLL